MDESKLVWDYHFHVEVGGKIHLKEMHAEFQKLGAAGWELTSTFVAGEIFTAIFKQQREKA